MVIRNDTIDGRIVKANEQFIHNGLEIDLIAHTTDPILVTAQSMMVSRSRKPIKDLVIDIKKPSAKALLAAENRIINNALKRDHSSTLDLTYWEFTFYKASRVLLDAIANKRLNSLDVLSERYTFPITDNTTIKLLQNYPGLYKQAMELRRKEWDFYNATLAILIDFWRPRIKREANEQDWEYERRVTARGLEDARYGTDQGTQTQFTLGINTRQLRRIISDFKSNPNPEMIYTANMLEKLGKAGEAEGLENYEGMDELLRERPGYINDIKENGILLRFTGPNTYISKRGESSEKTLDELIAKYKIKKSTPGKKEFQTWFEDPKCVVILDKPTRDEIQKARNILVREIIRETKASDKRGKYLSYFNNETDLDSYVRILSEEDKDKVIGSYLDGMRVFDQPGRALEAIQFRFTRVMSKTARSHDIRHRMVDAPIEIISTPDYGFMIPPIFQIPEIKEKSYKIEQEYKELAKENAILLINMQKAGIPPYVIQYHQLKGMRASSTVTMNGRQLFHYLRLRKNREALNDEFNFNRDSSEHVIKYLEDSHAQWDIAYIAEKTFEEVKKLDIFPKQALALMGPRSETFDYKSQYI